MRRVKSVMTQLIDAMRGKGAAVRYLVEGAGHRRRMCPSSGGEVPGRGGRSSTTVVSQRRWLGLEKIVGEKEEEWGRKKRSGGDRGWAASILVTTAKHVFWRPMCLAMRRLMHLSILALGIYWKHVHSSMVWLANYETELPGSSACKETFFVFCLPFYINSLFFISLYIFLQLSIHEHISLVYDHVIIFWNIFDIVVLYISHLQ
jgi:hypothetical protein